MNQEAYKVQGSILSVSGGLTLTISEAALKPDGYFTGGMLKLPDNTSRFIVAHAGDQITISRPVAQAIGNLTASIYPGCDHLKETCNNKFQNLDNFGGFPFIPGRNPFNGSSIA